MKIDGDKLIEWLEAEFQIHSRMSDTECYLDDWDKGYGAGQRSRITDTIEKIKELSNESTK